jgi:hypothetical protein
MSREASGTFRVEVQVEERLTGRGSGSDPTRQQHNFAHTRKLDNGTSTNQIDRVYSGTVSALDTTGATIDLSGSVADVADGSLTVAFAKLKTLVVKNTGSNNLVVGGSTHSIALFADPSDKLVLLPGACHAFDLGDAGLTIVNGTSDELKLAAASGTTDYVVHATGTSV